MWFEYELKQKLVDMCMNELILYIPFTYNRFDRNNFDTKIDVIPLTKQDKNKVIILTFVGQRRK